MSRKKSVILTPTEKKTAVTNAKDTIRATRSKLAELSKKRKELVNTSTKALKTIDKEVQDLEKTLRTATDSLTSLTAKPAANDDSAQPVAA